MGEANKPEVDMNDGHWHLDKRVNISLIVTVLTSIIMFTFFLSQTRSGVDTNARAITSLSHNIATNHDAIESLREKGDGTRERLAKVEEAINSTNQLLRRILVSVDRLSDRMDRNRRQHERAQ